MDSEFAIPTDWKPPRELARALPREVRLSGRGKFLTAVGGIFLLATIPVYYFIHSEDALDATHAEMLRTQGVEAKGEIARLWHQDRGRVAMVGYVFTVNGIRLTGQASVPSANWDSIRKAGFLPVRYVPSNPAINHPAGWPLKSNPIWSELLVSVMLAAGGSLLLWTIRRHTRVAAEGVPAAGMVIRCFRVKGGYAVRYRFRTKDNGDRKGSDKVARRFEVGSTVCILYLPDNPGRNFLYPMMVCRVVTE